MEEDNRRVTRSRGVQLQWNPNMNDKDVLLNTEDEQFEMNIDTRDDQMQRTILYFILDNEIIWKEVVTLILLYSFLCYGVLLYLYYIFIYIIDVNT